VCEPRLRRACMPACRRRQCAQWHCITMP
jgi:hypothetical protein